MHKIPAPMPLGERAALTMPLAQDYCGLKHTTIDKLIARGKLQSIKVGGRRLVLRESIDAFLNGRIAAK